MFNRRMAVVLLVGLVLLLAALPASAGAPEALAAKVKIVDGAFMPASVTIPVGGTVGWKNFGTERHTTTSDTGLWDSGVLRPGQVFQWTFQTAGTYSYHCTIHPTMTGTVVIR